MSNHIWEALLGNANNEEPSTPPTLEPYSPYHSRTTNNGIFHLSPEAQREYISRHMTAFHRRKEDELAEVVLRIQACEMKLYEKVLPSDFILRVVEILSEQATIVNTWKGNLEREARLYEGLVREEAERLGGVMEEELDDRRRERRMAWLKGEIEKGGMRDE